MLIFDLESDGLLNTVSVIHCGVTYNTETKEYKRYTNEEISLLINDLQEADALGGHNIIAYDMPVIEKLYGINLMHKELYDTLIVSRIAYYNLIAIDANSRRVPPRLKGTHGLKSWGYRLGENKGTYGEQDDAWSTYSTEMLDYCEQDVVLNVKLYNKLITKKVPWEAIRIEQEFAEVIGRQSRYGWKFDVESAQALHIELLDDKTKIEDELASVFTPLQDWIPMNIVPMYTKANKVSKIYQKQVDRGAHMNDKGHWGRYDEIHFNPGSRHHIRRWMEEVYNWHSPEKTEKGTPIINEAVLKNAKFPEAQLLRSIS